LAEELIAWRRVSFLSRNRCRGMSCGFTASTGVLDRFFLFNYSEQKIESI
jgi:hypothetical protein